MTRLAAVALGLLLVAPAVGADTAPDAPRTLRDLLTRIREGNRAQEREDARREQAFREAKAEQADMLARARAELEAVQAEVAELEAAFEANEAVLPDLEATLHERLGTLGELFGVVRQVAGDTLAFVSDSIVSAQLPDRRPALSALAESRTLPSTRDLEGLWFTLQEEMTESGRVVRFPATIVAADGTPREAEVVRVGVFNAVANGRYLGWDDETQRLIELARQPARRHLRTVRALETAGEGAVPFSLDPSRGTILGMLIDAPSLAERVRQGRTIGWVIIALGLLGLTVGGWRLVRLTATARRVRAQMQEPAARMDNPLGRIMAVRETLGPVDTETLELKLDEAILRETPPLERGNALVRVLSVAAPLLGLLGTVTGMIQVFQAITLHGTGDPRLMAGGISQALVTTVLGLVVAIPMLLLHSVLSGRSQALVETLEEQAAGIVARRAERRAGGSHGVGE